MRIFDKMEKFASYGLFYFGFLKWEGRMGGLLLYGYLPGRVGFQIDILLSKKTYIKVMYS